MSRKSTGEYEEFKQLSIPKETKYNMTEYCVFIGLGKVDIGSS